ncbi:MAG: pitrilysin family protein, partial [bacterium]|nr:pitrilysin family protein [bacterium]
LSDMLYHSKFDKEEIDRERGVIIEEINMYEDNPIMYIEDVFEEVIFQNTDLGRSIAGPRVNISTISRSVLHNYYKNNYYNGNAIIGIAGKFEEKKALALINKLFPLAKKQKRLRYKTIGPLKQNKIAVSIIKRDLEQVQLMLGFRSPDIKDKQFLSSQLLANILGGSMSSRLFLSIRERKGLCYFIRAGINAYQDHSAFYIRSGLNKLKIYEALSAIKEEVEKVRLQGVSALEFSQAKENMRGRLILKMEEASNNLSFLLSQEVADQKIKDFADKLKELDKISLKQINALAENLIDWSKCSLSIIGPFTNKNKFINILKK